MGSLYSQTGAEDGSHTLLQYAIEFITNPPTPTGRDVSAMPLLPAVHEDSLVGLSSVITSAAAIDISMPTSHPLLDKSAFGDASDSNHDVKAGSSPSCGMIEPTGGNMFSALLADTPATTSPAALHRPSALQPLPMTSIPNHKLESSSSDTGDDGRDSKPSEVVLAKKPRLERKAHSKSRRGCFNCKRRRIKCQETRPACGHCIKSSLTCAYPEIPQVSRPPRNQIPLFSLQDMRFFQHFLKFCMPSPPLCANNIWTSEVTWLSEKYEYLMHAILGLAASDLVRQDPSLITQAMSHRLCAIRAIQKAIANPRRTALFEEGNALIATCLALTTQSVLIEDGVTEFMTFLRGVSIVSSEMCARGKQVIYDPHLAKDKKIEMLRPYIEKVPKIQKAWVDRAVDALENIRDLCDNVCMKGLETLLEAAQSNHKSTLEAYSAIIHYFEWWSRLEHDEFQMIINPTNQVALLLTSHWIALKLVMWSICECELMVTPHPYQNKHSSLFHWLRHLNQQISPKYCRYNTWPVWVEEEIDRDEGAFKRTL